MTTLVIDRGNAGKVRELTQLLEGLSLNTQPQPKGIEVEETGDRHHCRENPHQSGSRRARDGAVAPGGRLRPVHRCLGGAPGGHLARYAATDAARIERLLQELATAGVHD